ncbi:hypothetical protein E2C01_058644 [Portunus trituberculatus]|uniref:Uncharacterized protein n=1 Tax=Portunus trituberculatus TaxID=210409 RepID=A0A5B7H5A1_PORTR|nr:hypothetical protein [Portunus trituberculatus]
MSDKREELHTPTQDDGQVLIVSDVLHLCCHNASCLLEEDFIGPSWVDGGELSGQAVVLPHPHSVHHSQLWLLIHTAVTCRNTRSLDHLASMKAVIWFICSRGPKLHAGRTAGMDLTKSMHF